MAEVRGIDVSYANGAVDWVKVKAAGIRFAILRDGFGTENPKQIDKQFERNYAECKRVGMPVGAYHYSYAVSVAGAVQEANFVLKLLRGKQFEYPIFFDIEDKTQATLSKQTITDMAIAFCTVLEQAGYWAGVYTCDSWFQSKLDSKIQDRFACWTAKVENIKPVFCKKYGIWQNSWKGKIPGSSAETDLNICCIDYPALIKNARKNGFGSAASPIIPPKRKRFCVTFTDVSTRGECEMIAQKIAAIGYTNHKIEEGD